MNEEVSTNVSETESAPQAPAESVPQPVVEAVPEMPAQKDMMPPEPATEPVQGEVPKPATAQAESAKAHSAPNEPLPSVAEPLPDIRSVPLELKVGPITAFIRTLRDQANSIVQLGKRKKLDRILNDVMKRGSITNDQVEKLLHVSDATATRYLSQLEKEGKLKQEGKNGSGVKYVKL